VRTPISRLERIAGVFIILALAALLALIFFPGLISGRFLSVRRMSLQAPEGAGLAAGDKVILQGVQVGEVTGLEFDDTGAVRVALKIYGVHAPRVRAGTEAVLVPPPVMGASLVRLSPGSGEPLPAGSVIPAKLAASPMDSMAVIAARAEEFMEALPALKEDLVAGSASARQSLAHVEKGLREFPEIMGRANGMLAESRGILESLKRNPFIRMNLPAEEEAARMVTGSFRAGGNGHGKRREAADVAAR
jgi:phospholipid/cholesterol/gamma-HCH transport system substrate-binding protein